MTVTAMTSRLPTFRKAVQAEMDGSGSGNTGATSGLQTKDLAFLSEADVIKKIGALFTADQKKTGILASISLAQFILESGYGKSELAQNCLLYTSPSPRD